MMSVMSMRRTTTCTFSLNVTRHVAFVLITSGIRHITDLFFGRTGSHCKQTIAVSLFVLI